MGKFHERKILITNQTEKITTWHNSLYLNVVFIFEYGAKTAVFSAISHSFSIILCIVSQNFHKPFHNIMR